MSETPTLPPAKRQSTPTSSSAQVEVDWFAIAREDSGVRVAWVARCADTKRWNDFAALYADDGYLVLPFGRLASLPDRAGSDVECLCHGCPFRRMTRGSRSTWRCRAGG